jgi:PAS domain S-box-containing protein
MSIYSIISFLAFLIYLAFGIYVLRLDPKSRLNRAFVLLAASFAVWALTYSFYYGAPNEQTAFFWYKISGLGRYLYPVFLLQIALILTKRDIRNNLFFQILIYVPAIIFLYGTFNTPFFIHDLVRINSEWYEILNTNSYWLLFYLLYNAVYDICALLLIAIWGYKSTDLRNKKQSQIIFLTGLLAFIVGGTIIILIPMLGIFLFPSIPQLSAVILFLGTFYAIVRYKLLILTPAIAAEEIVARITDLVIFMDSEGKIVKINQQMEKTLGYEQSELQGKNWSFIVRNLQDRKTVNELMPKILKEVDKHDKSFLASKNLEITYQTHAGKNVLIKSFISVIKDEFGIIGLVVVAQDMRQTKKLQQEIKKRIIAQEAANSHAKSLEVLNSIIISVNNADNIPILLKEVLKSALNLTNLSSGAIYLLDDGRNAILEHWANLPSEFLEKFKKLDTEKKPYNIITKTTFITGKFSKVYPEKSHNKDLYIVIVPIISQNKTIGNINIFSKDQIKFSDVDIDILESMGREIGTAINRIKSQDKVINSLKEKEVLLMEIHHRVKNNMQIISSIMNLESANVFDKRDETLFQRAQDRVQSMALIHGNLYQSKDLSSINFKTYLDTLTAELYCAYAAGSNIKLKLDVVDDFSLNMETAIPLGLIVNELVTNSLQYAFPQERIGEVHISLKSLKDQFELTVWDNGIGFPEELNFRDTKTLGLRLVVMLIDQLDGTIELHRGHGTKFKINFKKLKYEKRF